MPRWSFIILCLLMLFLGRGDHLTQKRMPDYQFGAEASKVKKSMSELLKKARRSPANIPVSVD